VIGIYKVINPKNKIYIGQSTDILKRFNDYKREGCKAQKKLYASLKKYGYEAHKFEIITECDIDQLNNLERYYQDLYDACGKNGLNLLLTTSDNRSGKLSEETKKRIGEKSKGRFFSEESKKKKSESFKKRYENGYINPMKGVSGEKSVWFGRKHKEESRKKMSENHKSTKEGYVHPNLGKTFSDELKKKLSIAKSKQVIDLETGFVYDSGKECYYANKDYIKFTLGNFIKKLNGISKNNTKFQYI
jgi:group I intron endonuclease